HGPEREYAIHVLDSDLRHVRSFGTPPRVANAVVRSDWGTGFLQPTADGQLMYSRRLPYELYRLSEKGEVVQLVKAPFRIDQTPDDAFDVEIGTRGIRKTLLYGIPRPQRAFVLRDGRILAGRHVTISATDHNAYLDLFSSTGSIEHSSQLPNDWTTAVAYDSKRNSLWIAGYSKQGPLLVRADLQ
ncbi:MAG: hypothetical protein ACRD3J_05715, partial [Thermoanaerobaculia bacterium]